jgi:peptidoglycan/xylan/chitin deacetylase (PgdA/CDA1 family)
MLKFLKNGTLRIATRLGIVDRFAASRWRQSRLLILCYHGISLKDEHEWSDLYVSPAFFRRRMETLVRRGCPVLPLNDALWMLRMGTLPPRAVVITFDDGFHDFHEVAFPILREFGFPATVYQTTYYSDHLFPIFNLALSYVFWRAQGRRLDGAAYGVPGVFDLSRRSGRNRALDAFLEFDERQDWTPAQKDELAARIAGGLGVDYGEIQRLRMLQLMTPEQVTEVAAGGIDVQLQTHRHRTPLDESLFSREIRDNREWIFARTGASPTHFCYPNGDYRKEFVPWLRAEHVASAVTSFYGLAHRTCDPLRLPRLLDCKAVTDVDFEAWLAGFSSLLPHRQV